MEAASFATQANALLRKNLVIQKRNVKTNLCLLLFPVLLCLLIWFVQNLVDSELAKSTYRCGCRCLETSIDGTCASESCTADYSSLDQAPYCAIPSPREWAPLLQVPHPESRADAPSSNFTKEQCRRDGNCPVTVLLTGGNSTFALDVAAKFFSSLPIPPPANISRILSTLTLGSDTGTQRENFLEPGFLLGMLYSVQPECPPNFPSAPVLMSENTSDIQTSLKCVQALSLWRSSSSIVNSELYDGYTQANPDSRANEYMAAYDFLDSNASSFNVRIWYNSTYRGENGGPGFGGIATSQLRIVRSVNVISNAYIKYLKGPNTAMQIEFIKEMPKPETRLEFDLSSIGTLFFNWVIELIFPVLLTYLVYEKQYKLRIMMKMHGLGDGPYWLITYVYFLVLSVVYILFFVVFGALIGLKFFTLQDYSLQFVFYFAFANLQIALAFFAAIFFNKAKSAQAVAYIYVFGSGLLAGYFFNAFIEDPTFSSTSDGRTSG